jgi:glyoxylase-like metal-dependent hydrolase (beta-lactamase superfamily II)
MGPFSYIECLKVGEIGLTKADLTYNVDFDIQVKAPIFVFLVRDSAGRGNDILVDAGYEPPIAREPGFWARGGQTRMRAALKRAHVQPEKIKTVVLTHLHLDHASFVDLFKKARFFVQAAELSFAKDPLPTQRTFYVARSIAYLERADLELLDGDMELCDGVNLTCTPGHTPGSQVVSVDIGKKTFTICGDTVPMYHNWFPKDRRKGKPVDWPKIPPGVHTDLDSWFSSCSKIEKISGEIIPSHDPILKDGTRFPGI